MLTRPARGHCPTNHPFVSEIEERTKRFITIEHRKDASNLARCHSQWQSRLFCLPMEIRDIIFDYASRSTIGSDELKSGPQCLTLLRMPVVWRMNLSWLRACRRIWLEGNAFAWKHAEPTFYRHSDRPDLHGFLSQLTALNVQNLQRLHIGQECHNLKMNDAMLRLFDSTRLQAWPPHLTVTLVAYPSLWEYEAIRTWFYTFVSHRKLHTVQDVEFLFHIPESQAENIALILQELGELEVTEWQINLASLEGKPWVREWGDVKLGNHWANKVDMPYRTFKLICRRADQRPQERPQAYNRDSAWDCWHLVPYHVMYGRRDSMEPDHGYATQLTERVRRRWEEEMSLLKFAE